MSTEIALNGPLMEKAVLKATEQVATLSLPLEIKEMKDYQAAIDLAAKIKRTGKSITEYKDGYAKPYYNVYKEINAMFKPSLNELKEKEASLKADMLTFMKAEQKRKDIEQEALDKQALELAQEGEEVIVPVINDLKTTTTVNGASQVRTTKAFEIEDPALIPREYLTPDLTKIKEAMKIQKPIPGVRFYDKETLAIMS